MLPALETVLSGRNGARRELREESPLQFAQGSESVLGRLVRQGKDLLGAHWSKLNSILFTPDLYAIQQAKNKALWKEGRVLWDMMALDDKVDSAHTSWMSAIVQDVRIIPSDDTVEAKWVADGFTKMLEEIPGGILDKFYMLLSGAGQGFTIMPFDLRVMGEGPWQGWFGLADLRYMMPHFLVPQFDESPGGNGELLDVLQADPYNRNELTPLDLDRCIHWVHRPQDDPFSGRSLYAPSHIHWQAKHLLLQLRNYLAELNVGRLVAEHTATSGEPGGMSEKEFIARAEPIIANYLRYKGIKKWRGMALNFIKNEAPLSEFNATIRGCDMGISRGIGPPWLTDEEGEYGTRAQADVHKSMFELKIRPVRQRSSEGFREKAVVYVCKRNGWASRHWPKVSLEKPQEQDQQKIVTAYFGAVEKGLKPVPADQNEARSRLGWPLVKEEDAGAAGATPTVALNGAQIQSATAIVSSVGSGQLPVDSARAMLIGFLPIPPEAADQILQPFREGFRAPVGQPPMPGAPPPARFQHFAAAKDRWWERPLTLREQRAQTALTFEAITTDLDKILERTAREAEREWKDALGALQHKVEGWAKSERISPKEMLRRLDGLKMDLDGFQGALISGWTKAYEIGQKQGVKELELAGIPKLILPKLTFEAMEFDARVAPNDPYRLGNFLELMKAQAFEVAKGYEDKALRAVGSVLMNGFNTGLLVGESVDRLDEVIQDLRAGHLITPGTPGHDIERRAVQETTVRTMAANAFNAARNDLFERNEDFVVGVERSEVANGKDYGRDGKLRSHPLSAILDGLKIRMKDPRRRKLSGARAFNDRGLDIPITVLDEPVDWSTDAELDHAIAEGKTLSPRFFAEAQGPVDDELPAGDELLFSALGDIWREIERKHPEWSHAQKIAVMLSKARKQGLNV